MSIPIRLAGLLLAAMMAFTGLLFTGQMPIAEIPAPEPGALTQYVNPFTGTGSIPWNSGMTNPGAAAPFGAVQMAPDTCWPTGFNITSFGTGGYYQYKTHIFGFSHNRVSGAGIVEGGSFRVTPALEGADPLRRMERPLAFSHAREKAVPGYYGVWLPGAACLAEFTATEHTGVHRYTFSSEKDAHLFLDATSILNTGRDAQSGSIKMLDDRTLEGSVNNRVFFYAAFDTPFKARFWADGQFPDAMGPNGETPIEASSTREGDGPGADAGADLNFGNVKDKPIVMRLGLSYVSVEGAKANLLAESAGKAFEEVCAATLARWEERLSAIQIKTGDDEIKKIFYTALYHSMLHPTNMTDVTGKYPGYLGTTGTAKGYTYRSDLSLWDTFRTTHPLYILVAPDIQHDSTQSLLAMAELHGGFPKWPRGGGDGGSMYGTPAHIVMAESCLKGQLSRADAIRSLEIMKWAAFNAGPQNLPMRGRQYYEEYNEYGYIPNDIDKISVSRTLEYAWADYATYLMAEKLGAGFEADAAQFKALGDSYKNVFDPSTKYFRPKNAAGEWQFSAPWATTYLDEISPIPLAWGFSEGSAKHYRWHAIQDPAWLVESMGGPAAFTKELEAFMNGAANRRAGAYPGNGWWVGNQHNYHAPYMFNEAGRPDLTQKWVRWTLTDRFADGPGGLDGNDDLGALSAWYIFGALGFYPVSGTDRYWIGSPNVEEAVLQLGDGKILTVKANNQGPKNVYVKSVTFNGQPLDPAKGFTHDLIKDGGTFVFEMANKP
ncbi:MAG: GH92 family glycosyl hydrolase [Oscillospiraceae bacterium]|nr:GH92 family glycosyl hydrolase [Oscillospiraceae bacterium]